MKPIKIYVDDTNADSLQQLKQHETALEETKNALLIEQLRLKKILQNLQLTQTGENEKLLFKIFHFNYIILLQ